MTDAPQPRQCRICGHANPDVLEVHHLVPQRYNGSDDPENLVHLCGSCHNALESLYDDRFYRRLGIEPGDDGGEGRTAPTPASGNGVEIRRDDSLSREIPQRSPHVAFQKVDERHNLEDTPFSEWTEQILHCGYCHTVFSQFQHPEMAHHLQVEHGIEDPYTHTEESGGLDVEGFGNERVVSGRTENELSGEIDWDSTDAEPEDLYIFGDIEGSEDSEGGEE